jgi:hypothetical protein
MEHAIANELVYSPARCESWIKTDSGLRPKGSACELAVDVRPDSAITNRNKALDVVLVIADEGVAKIKDVQLDGPLTQNVTWPSEQPQGISHWVFAKALVDRSPEKSCANR